MVVGVEIFIWEQTSLHILDIGDDISIPEMIVGYATLRETALELSGHNHVVNMPLSFSNLG
jgi:hypothetical protein